MSADHDDEGAARYEPVSRRSTSFETPRTGDGPFVSSVGSSPAPTRKRSDGDGDDPFVSFVGSSRGPACAPNEHTGPSVSFVGSSPVGQVDSRSAYQRLTANWPEPRPLPCGLRPVPPFDMDLLPSTLRPWIQDISERMQCAADYPAVAVMIALATVAGRKIAIRPKRFDDWEVVPNLWGGVVGRPGVLKSPAMHEATRPLNILEAGAKEAFEEKSEGHRQRMMIEEERQKYAKKQIQKALSRGEDPQELVHALSARAEPVAPVRRRYQTNDATVEKLGELLRDNKNGIAIFRDELIGFLQSIERDGQEGARAFYLEAWNGTGSFVYDRIGRGTVDIEAAIVSILGGIQPGPLGAYLSKATKNQGDDGFIQRFQLLVWPDVPGWKNVDRAPAAEHRGVVEQLFLRLDAATASELGAADDPADPRRRPFVRFAPAAQEIFDRWREQLESTLRAGDESQALESHIAKYRSLIPSLALLIHLAEGCVGTIEAPPLLRAIRWSEYLLAHARRVYASTKVDDSGPARALAAKILTHQVGDEIGTREIQRHEWSSLSSSSDIDEALTALVELGWLVQIVTPTGGAPKTRYRVNPRIWVTRGGPPDKTDKSPQPATSGNPVTQGGLPDKTDKSPRPDLLSVLSGVGSKPPGQARTGSGIAATIETATAESRIAEVGDD